MNTIAINDFNIISKIIDYEYVFNNLHKPWNWFILSTRSDFDFNLLEENYEKIKDHICWQWLSCNRNLDLDLVLKYPNWNWDWDYINLNPNITIEFVNRNNFLPWDKDLLLSNPTIAIQLVEMIHKRIDLSSYFNIK